MTSFRSLLGMKDKLQKDNNGPSKPTLPSQREIIEDIEIIKKNDPILSLAAILEKTGRHSVVDSDIKELMDAIQKKKRRESAPHTPTKHSFNVTTSSTSNSTKHDKDLSTSGASTDEEKLQLRLDYDKFKHFLTTCEHSQELISTMELEFKQFQTEVAEYSHNEPKSQSKYNHLLDSDSNSNLL